MRTSHRTACLAVVSTAVLLAAGCGGNDDASSTVPPATDAPTTEPITTEPPREVRVIPDIRYGPEVEGLQSPLLDVYVPEGADALPLVVLLHGGGADRTSLFYPELATEIATRGAVVVAPNWGATSAPDVNDPDAAPDELTTTVRLAGCALATAVERADEWGAIGSGVTLVGHSAGANVASMLAFEQQPDLTGCENDSVWSTDGTLLLEGELALLDSSLWEPYGDALPAMFQAFTPWGVLDSGYRGPVVLMATPAFRRSATNCDDAATWTAMRDPSGDLLAALEAVDATDDGCVDVGEVEMALAASMGDAGVTAEYVELTGVTASHTSMSPEAISMLADEVMGITRGGTAG